MSSSESRLAENERAHLLQIQAMQNECDRIGKNLTQAEESKVRVMSELETVRANEHELGEVRLKLEDRVRRLKAALQQAAEQNRSLLQECDALREEGGALREQCARDHRTISELG